MTLKNLLLGNALPTYAARHERLSLVKGIAIFTSDALSSVAYATEEILIAITAAGIMNYWYSPIIAGIIAAVLFTVGVSYRQIIQAYPKGGGAYLVVRKNLGEIPGLTAAATLQIDYILTVAVSIAAGVAAIVSSFLFLQEWRVSLCLLALVTLMYVNLRGLRESGKAFFVPTYVFMGAMYLMILYGLFKKLTGTFPVIAYPAGTHFAGIAGALALEGMTTFVFLRGFAAGCVAMTGTEAVSDGVMSFEEPEAKNASKAMMVMVSILVSLFIGVSLLSYWSGVRPLHGGFPTVLSQIAEALFGRGIIFAVIQASTAAILLLAANTAYQDFPRIYFLLALDGYWPRQFANRGTRLVFSNGIVALTIIAGSLIFLFNAHTHALIPLYAVGVFLCFTLSQSGMVRHWLQESKTHAKPPRFGNMKFLMVKYVAHRIAATKGYRLKIAVNGIGAIITCAIFAVQITTKFTEGAWILPPAVVFLVLLKKHIKKHYSEVADALKINGKMHFRNGDVERIVVIPTAEVNTTTIAQIEFARHFHSQHMYAISVTDQPEHAENIRRLWEACDTEIPITVVVDPYRNVIGSILCFMHKVREQHPDAQIDVVIPELIPRWWHRYLHNQTTPRIIRALEDDPGLTNIVVNLVPFKLARKVQIQ